MDDEFIEEKIHTKLWHYLTRSYDQDCVARNWKGWSYKVGRKERQKTFFYREFDIARFHKEQPQQGSELQLYGYEVKGYEKVKVRRKSEKAGGTESKEPAFALGIEQALILLYQQADFAYLVIPEPKKEGDRNNLKDFCDKFTPYIGVMFHTEQGAFWQFREAQRNPYSSQGEKKNMLASLISAGQFSDVKIPVWCKKHEF